MKLNLSGIILAFLGFFLTRFTVSFVQLESPIVFIIGGLLPLFLGLSLSVLGISLTVGSFKDWYVNTIVKWTLLGLSIITVLVIITIYGAGEEIVDNTDIFTLFSNVFIGGSFFGALTGIYAAEHKKQRKEIKQRTNKLIILNRFLRDEILNAITVIKFYTKDLKNKDNTDKNSFDVVLENVESIQRVMDDVKYLSKTDPDKTTLTKINLIKTVNKGIEKASKKHPKVDFQFSNIPEQEVSVWANSHLKELVYKIAINLTKNNTEKTNNLDVEVFVDKEKVNISFKTETKTLTDTEINILKSGSIPEYDDPNVKIWPSLARILIKTYRGSINASNDPVTKIDLVLNRADIQNRTSWQARFEKNIGGINPEKLLSTISIGLFSGLLMGLFMVSTRGIIPIIGALYGANNIFVGMITHEFHSVVFTLAYAGALHVLPTRFIDDLSKKILISICWAIILWFIGASILMPIWLNLVDIQTPVPNFVVGNLVGHIIWGVSLGILYHKFNDWKIPDKIKQTIENI